MKLRRGGVKNRGGNGGDRGVIGLRRDSGDTGEFANMNAGVQWVDIQAKR